MYEKNTRKKGTDHPKAVMSCFTILVFEYFWVVSPFFTPASFFITSPGRDSCIPIWSGACSDNLYYEHITPRCGVFLERTFYNMSVAKSLSLSQSKIKFDRDRDRDRDILVRAHACFKS